MKPTEAKRRVERIRKHVEENKPTIATDEEAQLCADFVQAAANGVFGHNARTVAREIAASFDISFKRTIRDE